MKIFLLILVLLTIQISCSEGDLDKTSLCDNERQLLERATGSTVNFDFSLTHGNQFDNIQNQLPFNICNHLYELNAKFPFAPGDTLQAVLIVERICEEDLSTLELSRRSRESILILINRRSKILLDDIDTALLHQHRILRRGIPFGDPSSETDEKGLLFLCYQTSIEKQFEHLFFKWMHDANFIKNGTGKDPILGFSNSNGDKTCPFKFPIQDAAGEVEEVTIELPSDIITLTGGEYFLSPSISSLALMTK